MRTGRYWVGLVLPFSMEVLIMCDAEFLIMLNEDEFFEFLKLLRRELRKDLKYDFETRRIGDAVNCYHNGKYEMINAIIDNYIYYMEKKYNKGRLTDGRDKVL